MSLVSFPPVAAEGLVPSVPPTVGVPSSPMIDFKSILDNEVAAAHRPWDDTIIFSVCPYAAGKDSTPPILTPTRLCCIDMCKYFIGRKSPVTDLYFNPAKYPPPPLMRHSTSSKEEDSLADLKKDIKRAGFDSGFILCTNGGDIGVTVFWCSAFRCRSESVEDDTELRSTSLVTNHKNRRQNRREKSRKRHVRVKSVFPFCFSVKWNEHGFYVFLTNNSGNP